MGKFNKYDISKVRELIETDSINEAIEMTIKNRKTKSFKLAAFVGQLIGDYTLKNSKHDLQMNRLCTYLHKLDNNI